MKIIEANSITRDEMRRLLEKPAFDEVVLGEGALAKVEATFGRRLTAEEVVNEIITAIRKEGNEAVFRYTKLIDGAELTPESMEVSEAEYEAAFAKADPLVVQSIEKAIANVRSFH
ncbi:MAG: histidinol dehydrogenase, partial [Selenomonadales bacterium]|nr:histidinol dehydrogenase [Selenomonadales bacterium]